MQKFINEFKIEKMGNFGEGSIVIATFSTEKKAQEWVKEVYGDNQSLQISKCDYETYNSSGYIYL